jgi:hypothetical protein
MAKVIPADFGTFPPLPEFGKLYEREDGTFVLHPRTLDPPGGGKAYRFLIDYYAKDRVPLVLREGKWRPFYTVAPYFDEFRFVFLENGGASRIGSIELELYARWDQNSMPPFAMGAAYASSESPAPHHARAAFDAVRSSSVGWVSLANPSYPVVVGFRFVHFKGIERYRVGAAPNNLHVPSASPRSWLLEARRRGAEWHTIHAVENQAGWTAGQMRQFSLI